MKKPNSKNYSDFQISSTALEKGINLLEASAGTGKTFTIEAIFVRLILEEKLQPNQILAVTFTEAATAELRDRIRRRLKQAQTAIRLKEIDDDAALNSLIAADSEKIAQAEIALNLAIESFDESQIFTIHGFCKRALSEYAFESGSSFNPELITEDQALLDEVAQDYWRLNFYTKHPQLCTFLFSNYEIPGDFSKVLKNIFQHHDVEMYPPFEASSLSELENEIEEIIAKASELWAVEAHKLKEKLADKKYISQKNTLLVLRENAYKTLDLLVEGESPSFADFFSSIRSLSQSNIQSELSKKSRDAGIIEDNPFTILCEEYKEFPQRIELCLYHDLLRFGRSRLLQSKAQKNVISFDDLLERMGKALDTGDSLANSLSNRYNAVLIDEFQDTDPLQWKIFSKIFGRGNHHFYLIGDPKQAIYAFRGADIFTYFNAAKSSQKQFSLATNYRSTEQLIKAVNAFFSKKKDVFRFENIQFSSVNSGSESGQKVLVSEGEAQSEALQFVPVGFEEEKTINKDNANAAIARHIANESSRLLNANSTIEGKKLEAGDIAILVRRNDEAKVIQKALKKVGLPSVVKSNESIFESNEAKELIQLLTALLNPRDQAIVRGLLLSSIFAKSIADLEELSEDESGWIALMERILTYKEHWNKYGFIAMYRRLFFEEKLYERFKSIANGERKLTNFLHLGELLNHEESQNRSKEESLLSWLEIQVKESSVSDSQEYEIRMESDEKAIQVVTMHKSKGLQYPVVFCPFSWAGRSNSKDTFSVYNSPDTENKRIINLVKTEELPEAHQHTISEESLSDNIRLLYVALTRGISRTYLYLANCSLLEKGTLAQAICENGEDLTTVITQLVKENPDCMFFHEDVYQNVEIHKFITAEALAPKEYQAKEFQKWISRLAHFGSFSGLTRNLHNEKADRYEIETEEIVKQQEVVEFIFPKGAKTGDFFHGIFEEIVFSDQETWKKVISEFQEKFNYTLPKQSIEAYRIVKNAMQVPLKRQGDSDFCLQGLIERNKRVESEFHYPIQDIKKGRLNELFEIIRGKNDAFGERLKVDPVKGYLKGFIDLMFFHEGKYYILDWKTNYLGESKEDYAPEKLKLAMQEHHYDLQYMLYVVALDLYLQQRLQDYNYKEHFGGVYYLFVRGIDAETGNFGVFSDFPSEDKLNELNAALVRTEQKHLDF